MHFVAFLLAIWSVCYGAFIRPRSFTLTNKLLSQNGSDANGGCPQVCVLSIMVCDCTGQTTDLSGITLINDVVPTFESDVPGWASDLYTVRTSKLSYVLGFQFDNTITMGLALREVELFLLFCPSWSIPGQSLTISVYRSLLFPDYRPPSGLPPLGNVTLTDDHQNCNSLTRISITTQTDAAYTNYFIVFSSASAVGGIYIGEVKFNDDLTSTSSTMPTSNPPTQEQSTNSPTATTLSTTTTITTTMAESDNMTSSITQMSTTLITATTPRSSAGSSPSTSSTGQTAPSGSTNESPTSTEASSSSTGLIVGILVGVIAVLLLLVIAGGVGVVIFTVRKKQSDRVQVQQLQDVLLEDSTTNNQSLKLRSPLTETSDNNNYERTVLHGPRIHSPTTPLPAAPDSSISKKQNSYSTLVQPRERAKTPQTSPGGSESTNFLYDDIAVKETGLDTYDTIDSSHKGNGLDTYEKIDLSPRRQTPVGTPKLQDSGKPRMYSLIKKEVPPDVPKKTPELYRVLKDENDAIGDYKTSDDTAMDGPDGESTNPHYASTSKEDPGFYSTVEETKKEGVSSTSNFMGEYSEVEGEASPDEVYSEVVEKPQPVAGAATPLSQPKNSTKDVSGTNPDAKRVSSSSDLKQEDIYTDPDKDIYTKPDSSDSDDDVNKVYDIIREPIEPSMFVGAEGTKDFKDEDIYAPIYDTSKLTSSGLYAIPTLQPENIKKVKTIGTGYFGKVILADTVGLSEKDLKLGDGEDKTRSIRVAVKQLKSNPSRQATDAFDKELKFMSRLNHENVVRVLGTCKSSTIFIVMEYMEKGDINQYLLEFESIASDDKQTGDLLIPVSTLTYMSAQIANGMKYLSSKNFIHRDLATRNCLIGKNLQVKIADFGMSRNLYQSHYYVLKGHAILPVRWMAKECFYGKFSTKTDVWAFGVTMWEIFTLAKDIPYEDMEDEELVTDATRKERRTLLAKSTNCPANVYEVMLTCWEDKPIDRASFDTIHTTLLSLINVTGPQ